ncbi:MAG: winged helix DNA-binding domain-containing protein [Chloroflexia bacterium]
MAQRKPPKTPIAREPLTWAQVNSWRLHRHFLAERAGRDDLLAVTSRLCGLHAQVMSSAELAAGVRREGGTLDDVRKALWEDRTLVKTWAMRGTLHLLTSEEMPLYIKAFRTRTGYRKAVWLKYFNITLDEIDALIDGVREALDGRCLTRQELAEEVVRVTGKPQLAERLRSGWGEFLKPAAFMGYLSFGPSQGQNVTFVRPDQWIGASNWPEPDEQESSEALVELLRRFLSTYGPATRDDFARWFGVQPADVRPAFAALAPDLTEVDVEGYMAWALTPCLDEMKGQSRTGPLVRLLAGFDPYTVAISTPQRACLLPTGTAARVYRTAGWISPVLLVDGYVRGVWTYSRTRTELSITVDPFEPVAPKVKSGIEAEAERLADLLGGPLELSYDKVVFGG